MFRSVRARLVAAYVFAAFVLVTIAAFGITVFSLSMFAISAREAVASVVRAAPDEVRSQVGRYGSLETAAPEIVTHLTRPGVIVMLSQLVPDERPRYLASGRAIDSGRIEIKTSHTLGAIVVPPLVIRIPSSIPPAPGGPQAVAVFGFPNDAQSSSSVADPDGGFDPFGRSGFGFPNYGRSPQMGGEIDPPPDQDPRMPPGFKSGQMPFALALIGFMRVEPAAITVDDARLRVFPDPMEMVRWIDNFWLAALPTGSFVIVLAWFFGRSITNGALRPLIETTSALERFAAGDFTPRPVETSDRSEIGALVRAYNGAVAQVSAAFDERAIAEERMRQFVADAGHELRTPLTVVMGFIDVLRRRAQSDAGQSTKIYDTMLAESRRMRMLIDKLISLARLENPEQREPDAVDIADLASRVVVALGALQPVDRVRLHADRQVFVRAHELELHEAISNLVENALKYAPGSPVDVLVVTEGDSAVVRVADRGPGLSEEDRARAFERFYRGENRGETEGFGLGLAIAKRAVERANGTIDVRAALGEGCTFEIRIPLLREGAPEVVLAR